LIKIAGVDVSFFRPRQQFQTAFHTSNNHSYLSLAYGEYDDNVTQVAEELGEMIITWDFEFVGIALFSSFF